MITSNDFSDGNRTVTDFKLGTDDTLKPITKDFQKFNELIGLPRHPQTFKAHQLTKIQTKVFNDNVHPKNQVKLHLNKARQCGWTELMIRILAFHAFHKYAGGKIIIITGTQVQTTKEIFARFLGLFKNIREYIAETGSLYLRLKNGTEIHGRPAEPEAITGWTKIRAILMDESAKWKLVDDLPVINAILPIVRTNTSDLFMISTPKGPRGFFYDIGKTDNDFIKLTIDIHEGGEELYTYEERMKMINSTTEDPDQEYLNKYTTGRDSIWGEVTEEHRTDEEEMEL